jgi:hypothetical protein
MVDILLQYRGNRLFALGEIGVLIDYDNQFFLRAAMNVVKAVRKIRESRRTRADIPIQSAENRLAEYIEIFPIGSLDRREVYMLFVFDKLRNQLGFAHAPTPVYDGALVFSAFVALGQASQLFASSYEHFRVLSFAQPCLTQSRLYCSAKRRECQPVPQAKAGAANHDPGSIVPEIIASAITPLFLLPSPFRPSLAVGAGSSRLSMNITKFILADTYIEHRAFYAVLKNSVSIEATQA